MNTLYGFTFMKDGVRYDYPFREMLNCMESLVDKCYVALGENDDGTSAEVEKFSKVEVIPTIWDMSKMGDGGLVFSEQTNIALSKLRENHASEEGAWAIYLQSDEIIHEDDFEQLRKDIDEAERSGCDAIRFRYFHFWMSHYRIAINKRWYPCEIRAVKVNSNVVNHGDAQGFSGFTKVYESDVHIYHYGHVRDAAKREEKQKDLIQRIRPGMKFSKYLNREKRAFAKTKSIPIRVKHSKVMQSRIERMGENYNLSKVSKYYIVGDKDDFPRNIAEKTFISEVIFRESVSEVPFEFRKERMFIVNPTLFERIQWGSCSYVSMESKLSREWKVDTQLMIDLGGKTL
ncbi:hypothetical protein BMS_0326 [Halobacteriovorax marinus SJ]|uniref:Uncharacterized protein n=1 Tax=Halobacteriovorax marinus (strain ATCC BAA-682 / DSM 15412 / SJ) TaxID=862908 RepID=E1X3F5_HALMS|nr:hypothetical protein [Halobacteriovorax marinus]CBW25250.1 hypothetical protein BMS_0326 [Halobacteriovorax marinus SJ]